MNFDLVEQFLENLEEIETFIEEEKFELITTAIGKNDHLLRELQGLKSVLPHNQWGELEPIKQKLIKRQGEVIAKLQRFMEVKQPEFKEMSQKVQASQAYNKMKRGY